MEVSRYSEDIATEWDETVGRCPMATFLHTRRYLSYHRDRFQDVSVLLKEDNRNTIGLFPAAVDPADDSRIVSHPGLTFGGLLHCGGLYGERMISALEILCDYYTKSGYKTLRYKAVPYIYHQRPSGDDLYALFRLGAVRYRCDLSCAIDLAKPFISSSRRRRGLKKALKIGIEVLEDDQLIDGLWELIEENLQKKIGEKPTHTVDEIKQLRSLFPENIQFLMGRVDGQIVAGLVLFSSPSVMKAQYIASSERGYDICALDAVFHQAISQATRAGKRYFDLGSSNRNEGHSLSGSLYQFKLEFGGGGIAHEFFDINLKA